MLDIICIMIDDMTKYNVIIKLLNIKKNIESRMIE